MFRYFWWSIPLFLLFSCHLSIWGNAKPRVAGVDLALAPTRQLEEVWPVIEPLHPPDSLRACCAFGYNLRAELADVAVPFFRLNNVVGVDNLGHHRYNDSLLTNISGLMGIGTEKLGILYTQQGGFIDVAHVRDTADNTLFLFSHIYPNLGKEWVLPLKVELLNKTIHFKSFTAPLSELERYEVSAYLAAQIAYQLAVWHEIAQWYGYRSVPGFSEEISAFSPEDLYSNLLGARLALDLILQGNAESLTQFSAAMDRAFPQALIAMGVVSKKQTEHYLDQIDGVWWDSTKRIPNKYLVRKRNYDLSDNRVPVILLDADITPLQLRLVPYWRQYRLKDIGELQMSWPFVIKSKWSPLQRYLTVEQFTILALYAKDIDEPKVKRVRKVK